MCMRVHDVRGDAHFKCSLLVTPLFTLQPPSSNARQRTPRGRATKLSRTASTPPPPNVADIASFHGTVVAAKEFDVNEDVKTLHSSFGKMRDSLPVFSVSKFGQCCLSYLLSPYFSCGWFVQKYIHGFAM